MAIAIMPAMHFDCCCTVATLTAAASNLAALDAVGIALMLLLLLHEANPLLHGGGCFFQHGTLVSSWRCLMCNNLVSIKYMH